MFENGNILHIDKYEFPDGTIKNTGKFLIVLLNTNETTIIASLTTSHNHVPDEIKEHGCIKDDIINIHCYHFQREKEIASNNFFFDKDTFIYFVRNVFERQIETIKNKQDSITLKGKLCDEEYKELVYCVYKSKFIKTAIKNKLEKHLEEILK